MFNNNNDSNTNKIFEKNLINFRKKLENSVKIFCCNLCRKILFSNSVQFLNLNTDEIVNWVNSECPSTNSLILEKNGKYSFCNSCANNKKKKKIMNVFSDFGEIPKEIKDLSSYLEYKELSLCSLYCNVYQTTNYGYWHMNGQMNLYHKNSDRLKGTFGIVYEPNESLTLDRQKIRNAFLWLKKNNVFYQNYLSAYEQLNRYFNSTNSLNGFPTTNSQTFEQKDFIVEMQQKNRNEFGLIINVDERKCLPLVEKIDPTIGFCFELNKKGVFEKTQLTANDSSIEPKLFPHLFPFGKGYFKQEKNGTTLAQYFRIRLLNQDPRWRNDRFYLFYAYDRLIRERIFALNNMIKSKNSLSENINVKNLTNNDYDDYFKYGNCIPRSITGSKSYWKSKYYDLIAIINEIGLPDLFVTLTANDSWPELKKVLEIKEKSCPIFNPVEVSEFFFMRLNLIMKQMNSKNGIFGEVKNYWLRIEAQNRGSLHAHMLLWLKNPTKNLIRADIPTENDHYNKQLKECVKKYQIHKCVPRRCFKNKNKVFKKCKYQFPFELCLEDTLTEDGNRYLYKRTKKEDQLVVPYNPQLLMLWNGHVNVQYVTKRGIEQYLVKYISKIEPTFSAKKLNNDKTEVQKYFQLRTVSSVEVSAYVMGHHFVQSNLRVVFIPTCFQNEQFKFLKKKDELAEMEPEDNDIFKESAYDYYLLRPLNCVFENLTIFEFHKKYEIIVKNSNKEVPKSRNENVYFDQKNNRVVKRNKEIITRTNFYELSDGEIYYYQKLLFTVSFRDFKDLISPNNITRTYEEECIIRNLIDQNEMSRDQDVERIFNGQSSKNNNMISLNDEYRKHFVNKNYDCQNSINSMIFDDIELADEDDDENCSNNFCSVEPKNEIDLENLFKISRKIPEIIQNLEHEYTQLTSCQKKVIDYIKSQGTNQFLLFVTGPAGTGKSFLLNHVFNYLYVNGFVVNKLATTGLAAKLIQGETAHGFFKINGEYDINLEYDSLEWNRIKNTDVIIIDEISMLNNVMLDLINDILIKVTNNRTKLFAGKSLIFLGDLFQLPAVSTSGFPVEQIYKSNLFLENFKPFILETNVRQNDDPAFQKFLNNCRIGSLEEDDIEFIKTRICGEGHPITSECTKLSESVNLCSLHVQRKEFIRENNRKRKREESSVLIKSIDIDSGGFKLSEINSAKIDKIQGSLERELELFPESPIMLNKNVDVKSGVVNGLTGTYTDSSDKVLVMKLETGKYVPVPKVRQRIKINSSGLSYFRIQFPIVDASTQTIHKVQGSTLKRCHVSIDNNIFSVGQAYVALSRVRHSKDLHLKRFIKDAIKVNKEIVQLMDYIKKNGTMRGFNPQLFNIMPETSHTLKSSKVNDSINMNFNNVSQVSYNSLDKKFFCENGGLNLSGVIEHLQQCNELRTKNFDIGSFEMGNNTKFDIIVKYFEKNKASIDLLVEKIRSLASKQIFCDKFQPDKKMSSKLHKAFLQQYTPIKTPGDGNCLYHTVSLCLFGNKQYSNILRFLTIRYLIQNKDSYKREIRSRQSQDCNRNSNFNLDFYVEYFFRKLLLDARVNGNWGNEYHLSALSSALNYNIYIYHKMKPLNSITTPEHLLSEFQKGSYNVCFCVKYSPLRRENTTNYICGFYFDPCNDSEEKENCGSHYSALLPNTLNCLEFRPVTDFFINI